MRFLAFATLCLWASAAHAMQDNADPVVATMVANMQSSVGQRLSPTIVLRGARAEARTLVLQVELTADTPALIGPPQVASMFAMGMCSHAQGQTFFSDGRSLRVEVSRAGRGVGSASAGVCPAGSGQGMTAAAFAGGMQSFVGMEQGGLTISAIRAEGNMMIVTIDVPAAAESESAGLGGSFFEGFCRRPEVQSAFFGNGLVLRVDVVTRGGASWSSPRYTSCPGR